MSRPLVLLHIDLLDLWGAVHDKGEAGLDLFAHQGLNGRVGPLGVFNGDLQQCP